MGFARGPIGFHCVLRDAGSGLLVPGPGCRCLRWAARHPGSVSLLGSPRVASLASEWGWPRPGPGPLTAAASYLGPSTTGPVARGTYDPGVIGLGAIRAPSGTSPLAPLATVYHDDGLMLVGIGAAETPVLMALLHAGSWIWLLVPVGSVPYAVAFSDTKARWLTTAVDHSEVAPAAAPTTRHPWMIPRGLRLLATSAGFTAWLALVAALVSSRSLVVLVPAMLLGGGMAHLLQADRVRRWERDQTSELLVSFGWLHRRDRRYFVRNFASD